MVEITGISILIPIYNYDIRNLVENLSQQSKSLNISVEILCIDDKSADQYLGINKEIESLPFVKYTEERFNRGRSAIRNFLALNAQYNHLIFLDCDSTIVNDKFLENYFTGEYSPVKVGGTVYSQLPPEDSSLILHYVSGTKREVKPAAIRNRSPYHCLTLNNIFIQKDIFQKITLDEKIEGYGHEDTKFGFELRKSMIPILHIDNPVLHAGLSDTNTYLKKTRESIQNLHSVVLKGDIILDTKLTKWYLFLKKKHCIGLFLFFSNLIYPLILRSLKSKTPSLIAFDIYKLRELTILGKRKKS